MKALVLDQSKTRMLSGWEWMPAGDLPRSYLHLVTGNEVENLRGELTGGRIPLDLEDKLRRLAKGDLGNRFIEQHCRTMIALFQAAQEGAFNEASDAECERLLQVLAYVRKDEDAIADYRPGGFVDDQREVRALTLEIPQLLQSFKVWRLRNQVPAMWHVARPQVNLTHGRVFR